MPETDTADTAGPVNAPIRVLNLDGPTNFRDLGGYPTADGGQTRWGMVFRADAPARLTPADHTAIERLGLRVAYDLRTDYERDRSPSALPDSVRREILAIGGDATYTAIRGAGQDVPEDFLHRMYLAMADADAPIFGRLLTALSAGELPALIHCTAGKDRTGVAAALLLATLGVDDATILDDYELSAIHFTDRQISRVLAKHGEIDAARYRTFFGAPRSAMEGLLTALREGHGSVEQYLLDAANVAPEALDRLRSTLVTPLIEPDIGQPG
ncbi:tyrosine-protein phosphatase [Nocardia alni]|uniref:tyrosine-protein phosphatase n=1 Tax=Nocardia alni TaxID=2815723 RepID=UPI001C246BA5|nr:tyrosine-protein phosphatase [Nocardia alni]